MISLLTIPFYCSLLSLKTHYIRVKKTFFLLPEEIPQDWKRTWESIHEEPEQINEQIMWLVRCCERHRYGFVITAVFRVDDSYQPSKLLMLLVRCVNVHVNSYRSFSRCEVVSLVPSWTVVSLCKTSGQRLPTLAGRSQVGQSGGTGRSHLNRETTSHREKDR